MSGRILGSIGVLVLAGCVARGSSDTVTQLPTQLAEHAYVSDIDIKSVPADAAPDFKTKLQAALEAKLKTCAKGDHPLRMNVSIARFAGENAAKTILVGSSNVIKGSAQLIEPADGKVVGDYDIARSMGGGGVIAAVGMAGAEDQMTSAFADEVCDQAFKRAR
jgi:hypothetical protein